MRSLIQPLQTSFSMLRRLRQFRAPRIGAEDAPPAERSIDPAALSLLRVQLLPSSSSMSKKALSLAVRPCSNRLLETRRVFDSR